MATFSERYGYVPPRAALQFDQMTEHYRNDLWNSTYLYLSEGAYYHQLTSDACEAIALDVLHLRVDEIPSLNSDFITHLGQWWRDAEWFRLYDVVETILEDAEPEEVVDYLDYLEDDFTKNLAPVRIVEKRVVRVDSATDVEAIEAAVVDTGDIPGARYHLEQALNLLASRESPDYPNSVKEAISAVEAVVKEITGKSKATLGTALDTLKKSGVALHPSLIRGWQAIYGYASDADGIRHSASDRPKVDQAEARYWLVTCSAFVSLMLKLHRDSENSENR